MRPFGTLHLLAEILEEGVLMPGRWGVDRYRGSGMARTLCMDWLRMTGRCKPDPKMNQEEEVDPRVEGDSLWEGVADLRGGGVARRARVVVPREEEVEKMTLRLVEAPAGFSMSSRPSWRSRSSTL